MRYNYQLHHVIIALAMQTGLVLFGLHPILTALVPTIIYTGRELYQFYYKKRTKTFDWGGCVPVVVAMILTGVMLCN